MYIYILSLEIIIAYVTQTGLGSKILTVSQL